MYRVDSSGDDTCVDLHVRVCFRSFLLLVPCDVDEGDLGNAQLHGSRNIAQRETLRRRKIARDDDEFSGHEMTASVIPGRILIAKAVEGGMLKYTLPLLVLLLPTSASAARHIVDIDVDIEDGFLLTDIVVQDGQNAVNRFTMHGVKKLGTPTQANFLALPPLAATFETYTFDENDELANSFAGRLATAGIEVWGLTPREANLVAGQCETMAVDCSVVGEWGLESTVNDALFVAALVKITHPFKKLVPGGLSYGSAMALSMIDRHPNLFGGIALWEVAMYSEDPAIVATNDAFCTQLDGMLGLGIVYDTSTQQQKGLAAAAQVDPFFHQILVGLLDSPPPSPVTTAVPNFSLVRGDVFGNEFIYGTDERVLGNILGTFMDYTSIRKMRDVSCALGGDDEFTSHLDAFSKPVLVLGSGRGFGPWMGDQVDLMGSNNVETYLEEDYGHVDMYMDPNHEDLVENRIVSWITNEVI